MDAKVTQFPIAEAKQRLSELVARAGNGERLTITRFGKPIAHLVPAEPETEEEAIARKRRAAEEWIAYRTANNITLGPDLTLRQLIDEGRRF
jgi:prevent-host-death family protein